VRALVFFRKAMLAAESLITLGAGEITEGELLTAARATIGGCHSGCDMDRLVTLTLPAYSHPVIFAGDR